MIAAQSDALNDAPTATASPNLAINLMVAAIIYFSVPIRSSDSFAFAATRRPALSAAGVASTRRASANAWCSVRNADSDLNLASRIAEKRFRRDAGW